MTSELEQEFEDFNDEEDTKAALNRALRALAKAKLKNEELVAAVHQAAADAASSLQYKPVKPPPAQRRTKDAEIAISPLADWQLAKVTVDYSTDVCEERIERLGDKAVMLTEIQRSDHPVKECRVYLLGDLIEGELVFPGQSHLVDASLYRQVLADGPRILGGYLRRLASCFEQVRVVGVVGNHGSLGGRARRDYHPESNADAMMYEATRLSLEQEKRITWDPNFIAGERKWFAIDELGSKRAFLFHGDQIKGGFAGFPWYAFGRKLQGWDRIYNFDYAFSGHFHTPVRGYYTGDIRHWGSGTTESSNTYAAESLAASGEPSQWLLFAHPEHGISAEYECHL
jgi:hypothetical protein